MASLISTNGPSVVSVLPSCTRTVVAVSGASRPRPGVTPGFWLIALVVGVHGLLLVLRKARPRLRRPRRRAVALVDQQHVLHGSLLLEMVAYETNGERGNRQLRRKSRQPSPV